MRLINFTGLIYTLAIFFMVGGCVKDPPEDPCLLTKWPQTKEYEIKLAVRVLQTNPNLPGGATGSQNPADFNKMVVTGTIEKVDCSDQKTGLSNLGNSFITMGVDPPASIGIPLAWWIGHVVYVYELGNDKDRLNINLTVKITMKDNQSYSCNVAGDILDPQIIKVPGEMYYYILLDIYSVNWVKV